MPHARTSCPGCPHRRDTPKPEKGRINMKRKLTSLLLAIVMALALLPTTAFAATTLTGAYCQVSEPVAGQPLPTDVKLRALQFATTLRNSSITGYTWDGPVDANGNAIAGNTYTLTITIEVNAGADAAFSSKITSNTVRVNGKSGTLISRTSKKLVYSYSFTLSGGGTVEHPEDLEKEQQEHAAELKRRWSKAEADASYPLGSPITLLVNEETLKGTDIDYLDPYSLGVKIMQLFGARSVFHTLNGETIDNKGLPTLNSVGSRTANHYRVTRVVYDYFREGDPSLDQFRNCTELWLSPKCDIDGILKTLGNITLDTQFLGDFFEWNCTVFIPDSLYPNGPTYTDHPAPGCRVMLYSGSDVYAAAAKGKDAARDWCTNHSYTYRYISEDRRYTFPTCCTDARFYYSCSKCGKCEYNPNHTFYPTVGSFDNGEDGGKNTAHDFVNKVVTDDHFLGYNAAGDRVYLYACSVCGKDNRQSSSTPKQWDPNTGGFYKWALTATVGKDHPNGSYAISNSAYIAAKQDAWATGEVLKASEAGLIDVSLMGNDYTRPISRLQFCSVAVKMAEKLAGKAITPAPAGTFTDTDNEYVRKASAAGITQGVGGSRFDPNGTLTRQQMGTFLYRALQWVKNNSDVEYTIYTSRLNKYTDSGQLNSWAVEAMGFMNALDLIKGVTDTTLAPNGTCTIEQAIAVAYRSLDAGRIGWYQFVKDGGDWLCYGDRLWIYFKNSEACCMNPYGFESAGINIKSDGYRPIKDR